MEKAYITSSGCWLFVHDKDGFLLERFDWKNGMEAISLLQAWTEADENDKEEAII
jgi:hypothetical protein